MNSSRNNDTSILIEPNPLLSYSLLPSSNTKPLRSSIPLPKTHIHRTPSELQLADDMRRAEYEDVRMYARLVVGMQSQCMVSGYVHPLTKKSLQDRLKTKQVDEVTLKKLHEEDEDDDDWELSYLEADEGVEWDENENDAPIVGKTPSNGSVISNLSNAPPDQEGEDHEENDDECLFSLEL